MASVRSLQDMRNDCRQRANMVNSAFVTDAEINGWLNSNLKRVWARVAQGEGAPHIRSTTTISVEANSPYYDLPADFWRMQEVTGTFNGVVAKLRPFMTAEHAYLQNNYIFSQISPVRYRVQASQVEFLPATYSFVASLWYTPKFTPLVNDSDTFDGYNGYEMAAIYDTVAAMLAKEESDPSFWKGESAQIYADIDSLSQQRDAGEPERVQDVIGANQWPLVGWPF